VTVGREFYDRPEEEAALFNAPFLARLLFEAAKQYEPRRKEAVPLPHAYLIPPVVLHGPTRRALPKVVTAQMASWTQSHPALLADFSTRATALAPLVGEACCFALRYGVLIGNDDGLLPGRIDRKPKGFAETREVAECVRVSAFSVGGSR
jgi:Family of unknown function (DUF6521)